MDIAVNWLAVLVSAVVGLATGWLWYGPLFGKMWMGMMGMTTESMKGMSMKPMHAMIGGFITSLVVAYVLAYFIGALGIMDVWAAMQLACWIWFGFMATQSIGVWLWDGKPFKLFVLVAAHQFVMIHLMALVLAWMM